MFHFYLRACRLYFLSLADAYSYPASKLITPKLVLCLRNTFITGSFMAPKNSNKNNYRIFLRVSRFEIGLHVNFVIGV